MNLIRNTNPNYELQHSLETQDYSKTINTFIKTLIPFGIIIIFAIGTFATIIICTACDPCCPICKKCRRDIKKNPYKISELQNPMIFFPFLFIFIFIASILGLIYCEELEDSIQTMRCAVLASGKDMLYDDYWAGLNQINERLESINEQLDIFVDKTIETTNKLDPNYIEIDYQQILVLNKELMISVTYIYDANGLSNLYKSYFTSSNFLKYISVGEQITKRFIIEEIRNYNLTAQQKMFINAYPSIIQSISNVKKQGDEIANDAEGYKSTLKEGQDNLQSLIINLTNSMNDFYSESYQVKQIAKYLTWIQYFYYGSSIFLCIFAVVAILFLLKFIYFARFCMHCVWCSYGLFMIMGFFLTFILYPTTGLLVEICDYSQKILTIQAALEKQNYLDNNTKSFLVECLYQEGDILKSFNIDKQIDNVKELEVSLQKLNEDSKKFKNKIKLVNQQLATNEFYLKKFSLNGQIDYNPKSSKSAKQGNIYKAIREFKRDEDGCKNDQFVLDQKDCDKSTSYWMESFEESEENVEILDDNMCFNLYILQTTRIDDRYSQCATQKSNYRKLKQFFRQQNDKWDNVNKKEQIVINQNEKALNSTNDQIEAIQYYSDQTASYINKVTNKQTGVVSGINCTFLVTTFNRFYDSICVKTVPPLFKTQLFVFIISVAMYFGSIAGYVIGLRYSKYEETQLSHKQDENIYNEQKEALQQKIYIQPNFTDAFGGQIQIEEKNGEQNDQKKQ